MMLPKPRIFVAELTFVAGGREVPTVGMGLPEGAPGTGRMPPAVVTGEPGGAGAAGSVGAAGDSDGAAGGGCPPVSVAVGDTGIGCVFVFPGSWDVVTTGGELGSWGSAVGLPPVGAADPKQ
jgi:hypothetical protein